MSLVTANLWNGTANVEPLIEEVAKIDPDVVVFQEVTQRHLDRLNDLMTFDHYSARAVHADHGHAGLGVWTRFDMSDVEWIEVGSEPQLRAWLTLPDGTRIRLYAVHAPAPVPSKIEEWRNWFSSFGAVCLQEMSFHNAPLVLAGDFNATPNHRQFRRLLRAGLRDAGQVSGRGWRGTWPSRWKIIPSLFCIDHVLVGPGVQVQSYCRANGYGSDHRPILARLSVLRATVTRG